MTAKKLYGIVTEEMDDFAKIRERIKARVEDIGYPAHVAFQTASKIAADLESAGYTDEQLVSAAPDDFFEIVKDAYGRPDRDYVLTLQEAYGKA